MANRALDYLLELADEQSSLHRRNNHPSHRNLRNNRIGFYLIFYISHIYSYIKRNNINFNYLSL